MTTGFKEFKYGTPVVVASALGIGLGMSPLPFYTIGVFGLAYEAEFGWPIEKTLSALMIFTSVAFVMSPVVGYITDRVGVRKVVLTSIVTFSLAMMAHALNNGSFALYLFLWSILSIFGAGTLPITWTRAVNGWFHERRGLALGISLIATGFFGAAAKIFASYVIDIAGWRAAYVAVGALPLLIAFPVAYFCFHPVDDPKVADKVRKLKEEVKVDVKVATSGMTLSDALRDWRFWLLAYAFVPVSFAVGGPIPNLERMMVSKGFDAGQAVLLAAMVGYAVFVGRLVGGYLLDKLWAPGVAAVVLCLPAISFLMLQGTDHSFATAAIAIFILGAAAGVEYDLMAYLVSKYFGLLNYSAIYGFLYAFFAAGAGFGPYFFGKMFSVTGSYDTILIWGAVMLVAGALPLVLLGRYREFDGTELIKPLPAGVRQP